MREIKFRAWDDGRMVRQTGALVILKRFFRVIREDSILMQFTGLHDKNDKEIYEGDIIKTVIDQLSSGNVFENGVVIFSDGHYSLRMTGRLHDMGKVYRQYYEIIGNIYENPELLKREQGDPVSDTTAAE